MKALAWCPWQASLLASGGGTADRCIRFWNCNTGTCVNTIDTKSQVSLDIYHIFNPLTAMTMRKYLTELQGCCSVKYRTLILVGTVA